MPLDPVAETIIRAMDETFPRVETYSDAAEARRATQETPLMPGDPPAVARVENRNIPGPESEIPVRIYWPAGYDGSAASPGVVYFHGGGWVICDLDTHDNACRNMANAVDAVVVSIDYRLAPEHKVPAAAEDCYAATQWVAESGAALGIDPARLAIAGDSAGGNLTACVALMARDRGGPALAFQTLIYPVTDSSATRNDYPSKVENSVGYFLTTAAMEWFRDQYLADESDGDDPYVSPLLAPSLADLPPAFVVTAEYDPLRDEGEEYAKKLEAAGVPTRLYRALGMFHGFFGLDAVLDGAKQAQAQAYDAMRAVLRPT